MAGTIDSNFLRGSAPGCKELCEFAFKEILSEPRWLGVRHKPQPEERIERIRVKHDEEVTVSASVLDDSESEQYFGVPLARRGIQAVWLQIKNNGEQSYRLHLGSLDPNYYSPLEAAFVSHFTTGKRFAGFGLLARFFSVAHFHA
jgi:hypothetical protein